MPWVVWITGLPGSGKSTVAEALKELIPDAEILRMDELRKLVTPEPVYSEDERDHVYRALVYSARTLSRLGHNVIIDATGNRQAWRQLAREQIPGFIEVYLKCPMELCIGREEKRIDTHGAPAGIYKKGRGGSPVPGINVPYEESENPELIIDTEKTSPEHAAEMILRTVRQ